MVCISFLLTLFFIDSLTHSLNRDFWASVDASQWSLKCLSWTQGNSLPCSGSSHLSSMGTAQPCPALQESLAGPAHLQAPRHHGKLSCPLSAVIVVGVSSPDWGRILPKEYGLAYNCIRTTRGHTHWMGPRLSSTPLLSIFLGLWCSRALGDSLRCFVWNAKTWHPMLSGINLISKSDSELALGHLYFSGFLSTSP